MTNIEKLEAWYEQEKLKGLIDIKFTLNQDNNCTEVEELACEMLDMIEASEDPARSTKITNL